LSDKAIAQWLVEPPPPDVQRALKRLAKRQDVHHVAVMPDVHLSRDVCVGVVLATHQTLVPAAVGGDIGCGMTAAAFDASADILAKGADAALLLDRLYKAIPVMRHRRSAGVELPADLEARALSSPELEAKKAREAALQFGTLGRGNHFVEFQADEDNRLWLMVHSGSRGMGQAIRRAHDSPEGSEASQRPFGIAAESDAGRRYRSDVRWALDYAAGNRARIVESTRRVVDALFGVSLCDDTMVSCHHNFVRRETHDGVQAWVHRKGAISARVGEPGIIPGSMGAPSFHVVGRGCASALCSSSHGAGRAMARSVARRQISTKRLLASMEGIWFDQRAASRLLEEAPAAYKDINAVMRAQRQLTSIARKLRPILAFKGT